MDKDREDKDNPDRDDDKAGYCKPPKKHRFKKGKSGNPKGRPKNAKGLKTDLKEELASQMTVKIGRKGAYRDQAKAGTEGSHPSRCHR